MQEDDARRLLEAGKLRNACDLDLLIFFARHPRSLLASESIATFLGYELKDIADSLELLLAGGLIHRKQTPAHAARLYVLAVDDVNKGWVGTVLEFASSRAGRLALKQVLVRRSLPGTGDKPLGASRAAIQVDRLRRGKLRRSRSDGGH